MVLRIDAEAMDRIHRLGQYRPVQAIKLVVEDSIESRIVQVCIQDRTAEIRGDLSSVAREKISHGGRNTLHR